MAAFSLKILSKFLCLRKIVQLCYVLVSIEIVKKQHVYIICKGSSTPPPAAPCSPPHRMCKTKSILQSGPTVYPPPLSSALPVNVLLGCVNPLPTLERKKKRREKITMYIYIHIVIGSIDTPIYLITL